MATRRKYDEECKAGAVRIVAETHKPVARVAHELGINDGTLGHWCSGPTSTRRRKRCVG
ncbi:MULTISPECIES: transposase [unclassified Arthrobacter]|uniref:transposase n=1 Tax=unclassified Arthrobacter TaxID=235627 RepID=UPI003395C9E7